VHDHPSDRKFTLDRYPELPGLRLRDRRRRFAISQASARADAVARLGVLSLGVVVNPLVKLAGVLSVLCGLGAAGLVDTPLAGKVEGTAEAIVHSAIGRLGWRTVGGWGLRPLLADYVKLDEANILKRDYGVLVDHTHVGGGCNPPPELDYFLARQQAYNALMKRRIEARHGPDVFTLAEKRAAAETAANQATFERRKKEGYRDPPIFLGKL
jgi:hypothetical protein